MLNLRRTSFLRRSNIIGRILRLPLLLVPDKSVVPILSGPMRGKKWIVGSHNHSVWLGTYESKQSLTFAKKCKGQQVFWDLGAHSGYYTLLFKTVNKESTVYSFEPVEGNFRYFQKHMALNNLREVFLFKNAVSDNEGILKFARGNAVAGKLSESGDMEVPVVRLSMLLKEKVIEFPDVIKLDIEGAEYKVLKDIKLVLMAEKKPVIFLSTHGREIHDACLDLLNSMGYKINPLDNKNIIKAREFLILPLANA